MVATSVTHLRHRPMLSSFPHMNFAIHSVIQASQMASAVDRSGVFHSSAKPDGSMVSHLDFAVQALIISRLHSALPTHGIIAEEESAYLSAQPDLLTHAAEAFQFAQPGANESDVLDWIQRGEALSSQSPLWMLDPIDSTRGLLSGAAYSIQLAGIWDGQVQVAVMGHPRGLHNRTPEGMTKSALLFIAARGHGAWWTTLDDPDQLHPLHVSKRTLKDSIRLRAPQRAYADQSPEDLRLRDLVTQELVTTHEIPCGATVRYPLLAAGVGDLMLRLMLSGRANLFPYAWDHAAGSLLVEEAGGRVTDLDGHPLDFTAGRILSNNRGLAVSNGLIHDEALAAIHRAEAIHRSSPA